MKNKILIGALALSFIPATAQNKLTPPTYLRALEAVKLIENGKGTNPTYDINSKETASTVSVFIELNPGFTSEDLKMIDYLRIDSEIGSVFICSINADKLFNLNDEACIRRVEIAQELSAQLDYARPSAQVDEAQSGFTYNDKDRMFDGTGVVCGMMDTGLEANHINFKNEDGTSRIKRLWHMNSNNGSSVEYNDQTIGGFTTDLTTQGHATHVAGILGGGYKGNGTFYETTSATSGNGTMRENTPIPYYGVATGSDLAFAVGQLYTPNITQGVSNIISYAESVGKPCVVNLSLGSTGGPHDGTDAYSKVLASLGKRAIICMSAGNDGDSNISIVKRITSATGNNSMLQTFVLGNTQGIISGNVDLWGTDNTVLTVEWGVYDTSNSTFTPVVTVNSSNSSQSTSGVTDFTQDFNGSIEVYSSIDPNNNRYNVYSQFSSVSPKSPTSTKYIAMRVTGASVGQSIYVYSSTSNLTFSNRPSASGTVTAGFTNGSAANSINDGACAENVISVGSYTTRTTWGRLDRQVYGYNNSAYTIGGISPFSSYGTTFQGTALPLVCGPGAAIISSYSSYYAGGSASSTMTASVTSGSNTYYWGQMQGTSMSCPFVSGVVGLWLQADPNLDFDKVMDVIKETSSYSDLLMRGGRWGYGQIQAVDGIKKILDDKAASVGTVWVDEDQRLIVTDLGAQLEVFVAGGDDFLVTVYDLQGRPVASATAEDGKALVDASQLRKGVYILQAAGTDFRFSRKIVR